MDYTASEAIGPHPTQTTSVSAITWMGRESRVLRRATMAVLAGLMLAVGVISITAQPADAAVWNFRGTVSCNQFEMTAQPGLSKNQYWVTDNYYYSHELQRWDGRGWKTVLTARTGWTAVGNAYKFPMTRRDGYYRIRSGFVWYDHSTGKYEGWGNSQLDHIGPNHPYQAGNYCKY